MVVKRLQIRNFDVGLARKFAAKCVLLGLTQGAGLEEAIKYWLRKPLKKKNRLSI